jgi:hypothetical protein
MMKVVSTWQRIHSLNQPIGTIHATSLQRWKAGWDEMMLPFAGGEKELAPTRFGGSILMAGPPAGGVHQGLG